MAVGGGCWWCCRVGEMKPVAANIGWHFGPCVYKKCVWTVVLCRSEVGNWLILGALLGKCTTPCMPVDGPVSPVHARGWPRFPPHFSIDLDRVTRSPLPTQRAQLPPGAACADGPGAWRATGPHTCVPDARQTPATQTPCRGASPTARPLLRAASTSPNSAANLLG